ncbi:MAG: FAD:protein FMN transferase [Deltaproteobacteria bacterium]|nr:FAD:protein FMN transferase [Deltaproteobacteria bacterium]
MARSALFLALLACLGCAPREITLTRSRLLMGHVPVNLSLRCPAADRERALAESEAAFRLAQEIEAKISEWQPDSELSCLNRKAGRGNCPLTENTRALLELSLALSRQTDGAFDIRFASPSRAGQEGEIRLAGDRGALPHPETRIGVGAIGKGWIVDAMLDYLQGRGYAAAIVDAGGDLRALGGPWKVAIQVPEGAPDRITVQREIRDRALATSGLYEQGSHILDPSTRRPVARRGSVSVEASRLAMADALATAFFVLGETKSLTYLPKFPGVKMYWTDPDGNVRAYAAEGAAIQAPK